MALSLSHKICLHIAFLLSWLLSLTPVNTLYNEIYVCGIFTGQDKLPISKIKCKYAPGSRHVNFTSHHEVLRAHWCNDTKIKLTFLLIFAVAVSFLNVNFVKKTKKLGILSLFVIKGALIKFKIYSFSFKNATRTISSDSGHTSGCS